MPKVFFATDLHGSEVCWKKFLNSAKFYGADVLICGGDMTGKAIVPIVAENGHFTFALGGEPQAVAAEQVAEVEANIRRKGYYPLQMSVERLHELDGDPAKRAACFQEVMLDGVDRWMKLAAEKLRGTGIRCFVSPGNDDEMEVDDVIRRAELVELAEGRVVEIEGFSMISTGWSNPTPWKTHREESEEQLAQRIDAMATQVADKSRAIFNLHCPPYKSGLDEAPAIDADLKLLHGGRALRPVGSTAVRQAIEKHQPLISLHGHIHESKGAVKIGKTLSINPGSAYEEGMLMGAIVQLDSKKGIKSYQLVNG
jgi:Icc-related predicted phosphoesterase